jgi:hypothetical protein
MTETNKVSRLYLDSNVFIYAIEGKAELADLLRELFDLLRAHRGVGVTSEFSVLPPTVDNLSRLIQELA